MLKPLKMVFGMLLVVLLVGPAFAQTVDTAWVRTYNGPADSNDVAVAITVDGSGNVCVTGYSRGSGTHNDYATIKYYPNGDTAWLRRYDGPADTSDWPRSIAADGSGNVFVAGGSYGNGTRRDFATVKYYPNGDTAWVRRYNGPENHDDEAFAMTGDDSGHVYVTGANQYVSGPMIHSDYATVKYHSNGDTVWIRRYNAPQTWYHFADAIAVDLNGNVYVTGVSVQEDAGDYATVKYYPNGDTAWVRKYDGPVGYDDCPSAIAVDDSGNVYVTGYSHQEPLPFNKDYATIKYHPNGDTAWVRRYDGPGNHNDGAEDLVVDDSGSVYVTGYSSQTNVYPYNSDYATIKYHPNGDTAWVRRYDGPDNLNDEAAAIALDDSGNVYVTGYSCREGSNTDCLTIKYSPEGDELWVARYEGTDEPYHRAHDITIDDAGNVYITGTSSGSELYDDDYCTIKYLQASSGVRDEWGERERPSEFDLSQNYPNPFNPTTKIEFTLAKSGFVTLQIYDTLGRKVRTLVSEELPSGYKSVIWDGKNEDGNDVASAVYFYQLKVGDFSQPKKMLLLK